MLVTKCDLCKKRIKGQPIIVGVGFLSRTELCEKCGAPIFRFLRKYKFIDKEKKINKK